MPYGLEKYMSFAINNKLSFIDSFQFLSSSSDSLARNLNKSYFKGTLTDIWKTVFRKVLFMWSRMPIFSFIGYTLREFFRKLYNWRQFYKQASTTFYTSNQGYLIKRRRNYQYVIKSLWNSYLISYLISCLRVLFRKNTEASTGGVL